MRRSFVVAALLAAGTTACATLGMARFKEPVVVLRNAQITGLGVTGGSMEVVLDVYNPNNFKLDGTRLTYKVMVDSLTFGSGAYDTRFVVEKGDTSQITLPFSFTYEGVGSAGRQLMQTGSVEYRVLGDVTVSTPLGNFTRSYDQKRRFNTLSR
jgi:LEA14-like dessication related protein